MTTLEICSEEMIRDLCKAVPLMNKALDIGGVARSSQSSGQTSRSGQEMTNIQLYRLYIETYLRQHPEINTDLDIIVTQKESTAYGLPIEVYFFLKDKRWAYFERKQSDIFDHLMAVAPEFGLKLYQRP